MKGKILAYAFAIIMSFEGSMRLVDGDTNWKQKFSKCDKSHSDVSFPYVQIFLQQAECKGQTEMVKECPLGFTYNEQFGSCYNFVTRQKMIWIHALAYCTAQGANLAAIETQEELTFIQQEIIRIGVPATGSNTDSFYTGGTSINGAWQWIGGPSWPTKPMEFAPWEGNQGSTGDQLCHTLWGPWGYLWGDLHCTSTFETNFICEIKLD